MRADNDLSSAGDGRPKPSQSIHAPWKYSLPDAFVT